MLKTLPKLRVMVVDDNRDGADAFGLLIEELGHQVHVTYGGRKALEIAVVVQPDLMFVDLLMPDVDGCTLAKRLREIPSFAPTTLLALTGQKDHKLRAAALSSGFSDLLLKPPTLKDIKTVLAAAGITEVHNSEQAPALTSDNGDCRLPMEQPRQLRRQRMSRALTQQECESAIHDAFVLFQKEYLGRQSEEIQVLLIQDFILIRIRGALTRAERHLATSGSPRKGCDVIKLMRQQLLEVARPMLSSLIHDITGVQTVSLHHDISTVTGEEVAIFSLASHPTFA